MSNSVTLKNIDLPNLMLAVESIICELPDEAYDLIIAALNYPMKELDEAQATIADLKQELNTALDEIADVESALDLNRHLMLGKNTLAEKVKAALAINFEDGCEAASMSAHQDLYNALHYYYGIDSDKAHAAASYLLSMDENMDLDELSEASLTALQNFINTLGSQEESENE